MNPILITGAAGSLGSKLAHHLRDRYPLRLLDRESRGQPNIHPCDLSRWDPAWVSQFQDVDTVYHFAADPEAYRPWEDLLAPNIDAAIHVFQAAIQKGVRRFVYASSNHVMAGYRDKSETRITPELPPRPGMQYTMDGQSRDTTPYAAAKVFGEQLGKCYSDSHGLEVIAVRFGWMWRRGPNTPEHLPTNRGDWFRKMWLSDRDFCHLMERCLLAELPGRFVIVNGMSANAGMQWDLESTCRILGYQPQDDVARG